MVSFPNMCSPILCLAIWFQNSSLYHFSMFHASHHITPIPASNDEASFLLICHCIASNLFSYLFEKFSVWQIEAEASAVKSATEHMCHLKIVLDRVILTSTGVLLGCWQVNLLTYGDVTLAFLDRSSV